MEESLNAAISDIDVDVDVEVDEFKESEVC
jgi:hypothetical protein